MPEIMRPELIDLTDAEVEAVSGGQEAVGGRGGNGGDGGDFEFDFRNVGNGGNGGRGGNARATD